MEDLYPYDVDKAKSLMSEAGVSKPTLKVLYRNDSNGSTKTFETAAGGPRQGRRSR